MTLLDFAPFACKIFAQSLAGLGIVFAISAVWTWLLCRFIKAGE